MPRLQGLTLGQCLSPTPSVLGGRGVRLIVQIHLEISKENFSSTMSSQLQSRNTDHRINCNRHAQLFTVSTESNKQHTQCYTHSDQRSPFCTCVGKCTSLWFPERLLGSQSPISPLNAAGPEGGSINTMFLKWWRKVSWLCNGYNYSYCAQKSRKPE